jgi:hypothetical protein
MKTPRPNRVHRLAPWLVILLIVVPAVRSSDNRLLVRYLGEGGNSTDDYVENSIVTDISGGEHTSGDMKVANNVTSNESKSKSGATNELLSSSKPLDETEVNDAVEKVSGGLATIKGAEKTSAQSPVWPDDDDDDFIAKKSAGKLDLFSTEKKNDFNEGGTSQLDHGTEVKEEADELDSKATAHDIVGGGVNSDVSEKVEQDEMLSSKTTEKSSLDNQEDFSGAKKGAESASETNTEYSYASSQNEYESIKASAPAVFGNKGDEIDPQTFERDTDSYLGFDQNMSDKQSTENKAPTDAATFTWGEHDDAKPIGISDTTGSTVTLEPLHEGTPSSEVAYHRNESNQEEHDGATNKEDEMQPELEAATHEESKGENTVEKNDGSSNKELDGPSALCPATSCMECINLSVDHLRSNSDPCYWMGQCISAGEASRMENSPSGAYKCGEDGSAIYTGEEWIAVLNVIAESSQMPIETKKGEIPMNTNYFDGYEDEDDGFLENVKFLFNVLLLAACLASGLLIRKRVMNRLRDDPTLETADVVKEEVISFVTSIAIFVKDKLSGSGSSANHDSEYRPIATNTTNESFERQAIPLSTAADEEWGWDDEEAGPSVELGEVGGDDAKEEEDLALAIAMSLSESTNGSSNTSRSQPSKPVSSLKPNSPTPFSARLKEKKSPIASPKPKARVGPTFQQPASPAPPPSVSSQGDSIEDLLGQMNAGSASVITSFGQKKTTAPKPKPAYQKKDSVDDMFTSMGLSNSYASKSATTSAPKSAPLPPSKSLAADNDDDDLDWGDDGDLDDLLDD